MVNKEVKEDEKCPTCGKTFKNLAKHKCKEEESIKTEEKTSKKTKIAEDEKQVIKDESKMLVPSDDYLSAGVHIGSKVSTGFMKEYVFKIRPDGLAIMNVSKIDERLKTLCDYLARFNPEEILMVCKRDTGTKPLKMLTHATGIKSITGRYLPGTMTNPDFKEFIEPKVVLITDSWYDKQALIDAIKAGAVVVALCNTSTITNNVDFVIPCNNKGHKALGLVFYVIAREYAKTKKKPFDYKIEQFN